MNSFTTAAVVFGCVFGGALLGIFIRRILPHHHLNSESKDTVKLGMGLVGTMAALVLGLLVASAKGSYECAERRADADVRKHRRPRPPLRPVRLRQQGGAHPASRCGHPDARPVVVTERRRPDWLVADHRFRGRPVRHHPGTLAEERHATIAPEP